MANHGLNKLEYFLPENDSKMVTVFLSDWLLRRKMQHILIISKCISPWKKMLPFIFINKNPIYTKMICWNWSWRFGDKVNNVNSLQTNGQSVGRRTKGYQINTPEFSAQMSYNWNGAAFFLSRHDFLCLIKL